MKTTLYKKKARGIFLGMLISTDMFGGMADIYIWGKHTMLGPSLYQFPAVVFVSEKNLYALVLSGKSVLIVRFIRWLNSKYKILTLVEDIFIYNTGNTYLSSD